MLIKITEAVRAKALRRPLVPAVYHDSDIKRFALVVTTERAFWAQEYQLRGINPRTGKRYGGGTRYEIGDAVDMPLAYARAAALKVKAAIREGRDPHGERVAKRKELARERSIVPTTVSEALDIFEKMLMAKAGPKPSPRTRAETIRYGRKAVRLMKAEAIAVGAVTTLMARLMLDDFPNSQAEKRLTFSGLNQFLTWCRRREMIERNPLDDLDRGERPKPGVPRKNAPMIRTLRMIWAAVETEPAHARDMIRFGLLTALRRDEFAELAWSEVDMAKRKVTIGAGRMKNREEHTLPALRCRVRHPVEPPQTRRACFPHAGWQALSQLDATSPSHPRTHRRKRQAGGAALPASRHPQKFQFNPVRRGLQRRCAGPDAGPQAHGHEGDLQSRETDA